MSTYGVPLSKPAAPSAPPSNCAFLSQVSVAVAIATLCALLVVGDVQYTALQRSRGLRTVREGGLAAYPYLQHSRPRSVEGLPACARNASKAKTFLLVFMGHSGSTAIVTALQQHSEVLIESLEPVDHSPEILANETRAIQHAEQFFEKALSQGKVGGFKIRPRHFESQPKEWMRVLQKYDTRIILNFRNNLLKQAIGHYPIKFLNSTDAYEGLRVDSSGRATPQPEDAPNSRLRIDNMEGLAQLLRDRILGEDQIFRSLANLGRFGWDQKECTLPVSYEGFLQDWRTSLERVQAFLGISTAEMHIPLRKKVTRDNLCELVENFADVCAAFFRCKEVRWMLDDPANGCMCSRLVTTKDYVSNAYCPSP